MNREAQIKSTINKINRLPDNKIPEVEDFVDFLLSKIDDSILTEGIEKLTSYSKSFEYLKNEENLYTVNDLKDCSITTFDNFSTSKNWNTETERKAWKS